MPGLLNFFPAENRPVIILVILVIPVILIIVVQTVIFSKIFFNSGGTFSR